MTDEVKPEPTVADLTVDELLRFEWCGNRSAHWLRDILKTAKNPPEALVQKLKVESELGKLCDEELTRRGVGERYC